MASVLPAARQDQFNKLRRFAPDASMSCCRHPARSAGWTPKRSLHWLSFWVALTVVSMEHLPEPSRLTQWFDCCLNRLLQDYHLFRLIKPFVITQAWGKKRVIEDGAAGWQSELRNDTSKLRFCSSLLLISKTIANACQHAGHASSGSEKTSPMWLPEHPEACVVVSWRSQQQRHTYCRYLSALWIATFFALNFNLLPFWLQAVARGLGFSTTCIWPWSCESIGLASKCTDAMWHAALGRVARAGITQRVQKTLYDIIRSLFYVGPLNRLLFQKPKPLIWSLLSRCSLKKTISGAPSAHMFAAAVFKTELLGCPSQTNFPSFLRPFSLQDRFARHQRAGVRQHAHKKKWRILYSSYMSQTCGKGAKNAAWAWGRLATQGVVGSLESLFQNTCNLLLSCAPLFFQALQQSSCSEINVVLRMRPSSNLTL